MKNVNTLTGVFLLLVMANFTFGQTILKGRILSSSNNEVVVGAGIEIKGTTAKTLSGMDGDFQLTVENIEGKQVLAITHEDFNFKDLEVKIKANQSNDLGTILLTPFGEVDIFDLDFEQLMNLEVSGASNVVSELKKMPVTVTRITKKQLEMSGGRSLADAIMVYVPGFFIVEDQDDLIAGFRGLAPDNNSKVMLLINGQSINTEWFWGPPAAILNNTDYGFIEKVEVIRGPGSVTLGQGALLGVINIVTKTGLELKDQGKTREKSAEVIYGKDDFLGGAIDAAIYEGGVNAYMHIASHKYGGQDLRNKGWTKDKGNEGYHGGNVFNIGTKLRRTESDVIVGSLGYKDFRFDMFYANQKRDLYNFYRDRNQADETLMSMRGYYNYDITSDISLKANVEMTTDNFGLSSVDGYTMGGTRENRFGGKVIFNINSIKNNKLAVGAEFKRYSFGKENLEGNNFINNVITDDIINDYATFLSAANDEKIWGYSADLNVYSLILEDFYNIKDKIDLFGAFRFDNHPYWGSNFSPRVGLLYYPINKMRFRFTYQTGFRGAVGLHYGGGYRQDGFLAETNFDKVEAAQIPILNENGDIAAYETNIPKAKPESMQSIELALDWDFAERFNFYGVGFYNIIENVIDVGVIWRDASQVIVPSVGTDVPGDWNGYWYFKNTEGNIVQGGAEASLSYTSPNIIANISHSTVSVVSVDEQNRASMYITAEEKYKAYPANVTRLNVVGNVTDRISMGLNYLYYYNWNSPSDQIVEGNHMMNITATFDLMDKLTVSTYIINVLGEDKLYPMNSNAGDATSSDGTPAYEKTTFWLKLKYNF